MNWSDNNFAAAVVGEGEVEADAVVGQEVGDVLAPFNNYDGIGATERSASSSDIMPGSGRR